MRHLRQCGWCGASVGFLLALLLLTGCSTFAENRATYDRLMRERPGGEQSQACEAQRRQAPDHTAHVVGSVVAGLIYWPLGVLAADNDRRVYRTLCMGEAGWTLIHPDGGYDMRPMTPAELAAWPDRKAAILDYEQARTDSIRRP